MNTETNEPQFVTFASNAFEMFASCIAVRSLELCGNLAHPPIVLAPEDVVKAVEEKYAPFKLRKMLTKSGAELKTGYRNGYNPRNAYRIALKNLARKSKDVPIVYFAPTTYFKSSPKDIFTGDQVLAAKSPDDFWPMLELYGPSMDDMWKSVIKFAEVDADEAIDKSHPENYWMRYPQASTSLIYLPKPEENAASFEAVSRALIEAELPELVGQERDLLEPTMAAFLMREKGALVDVAWDEQVISYQDFSQFLLRMSDADYEILEREILDTPLFRQSFKKLPHLRAIFYTGRLRKIRSGFDEMESAFGMQRTNLLIDRREIDKQIRKLTREVKKKLEETAKAEAKKPKNPQPAES